MQKNDNIPREPAASAAPGFRGQLELLRCRHGRRVEQMSRRIEELISAQPDLFQRHS